MSAWDLHSWARSANLAQLRLFRGMEGRGRSATPFSRLLLNFSRSAAR